MEDEILSLCWNNHDRVFSQMVSTLREKEQYTDATLACDRKFYPVHKFVLSTCSEYFESMFEHTPCKHPIIVLKDVKCDELEALLSYMYAGVVSISKNNLSKLIKAANALHLKGLTLPSKHLPDRYSNLSSSDDDTKERICSQPKRKRNNDNNTPRSISSRTSSKTSPSHTNIGRPRTRSRVACDRLGSDTVNEKSDKSNAQEFPDSCIKIVGAETLVGEEMNDASDYIDSETERQVSHALRNLDTRTAAPEDSQGVQLMFDLSGMQKEPGPYDATVTKASNGASGMLRVGRRSVKDGGSTDAIERTSNSQFVLVANCPDIEKEQGDDEMHQVMFDHSSILNNTHFFSDISTDPFEGDPKIKEINTDDCVVKEEVTVESHQPDTEIIFIPITDDPTVDDTLGNDQPSDVLRDELDHLGIPWEDSHAMTEAPTKTSEGTSGMQVIAKDSDGVEIEGALTADVIKAELVCSACFYSTTSSEELMKHMQTHTKKKFECNQCGEKFSHTTSLKRHKIRKHPGNGNIHVCSLCKKKFNRPGKLNKHILNVHPNANLQACSGNQHSLLKGQSKGNQHSLLRGQSKGNQHSLLKSQSKGNQHSLLKGQSIGYPHICSVCGDVFSCTVNLRKHRIEKHSQRRRMDLECPECGQEFNFPRSLKSHMLLHCTARNYVCLDCGFKFKKQQNLSRHMLTHLGRKPFGCPECGERFTRRDHVKRHQVKRHNSNTDE